jgi:LPS-assembly lipoprotein
LLNWPARLCLLAAMLSLTACGLHLRGHGPDTRHFAFHSIYIAAPADTDFTKTLHRGLERYKLDVEPVSGKQQLTLQVISESTEKQITALNASGHVVEYLLHYRVMLRAYDQAHDDWLPPTTISLQRILPYDVTLVLAKQIEEQMLYKDMRTDAADQVLRRLAYARPPKPPADGQGQP